MTHRIPRFFNMRRNLSSSQKAQERVEHWQTMTLLNPTGFRSAPTSRKNRNFHKKGPATKLEALYKLAEMN